MIEAFQSAFNQWERLTPVEPWLASVRSAGMKRFEALGFPTTRQEEWRFTDVSSLAATSFQMRSDRKATFPTQAVQHALGDLWEKSSHLIFINGIYSQEFSKVSGLPKGVVLKSLKEAARTHREVVEANLGKQVSTNHPFVALNTAFLDDGAFLQISADVVLEQPIYFLFLSSGLDQPEMWHPRNLIVAERGAQAQIVECYIGSGSKTYFSNVVTEIAAGDNAGIDHVKIGLESDGAFHVASIGAGLARLTRLRSHSFTLGGGLVRNEIGSRLNGEGGEVALNGLYVTRDRQLVDNHTTIDHLSSNCQSRELYKGVLDDSSRGVFNGKIVVRPNAQKTDAQQSNKNILLSKEALVDTTPQLEIFANDVKCSHGATIGRLSEAELFYLRSRGIGEAQARRLLIHAFANEVVREIKHPGLRLCLQLLVEGYVSVPSHEARS